MSGKIAELLEDRYAPMTEVRKIIGAWDNSSGKYDAVKMRCFSKSEADEVRDLLKNIRPDIPVYFTWMEFGA